VTGAGPAPLDEVPGARISTLPDGTIIEVNRAFLLWTGYDEAKLLDRCRFQDLLPPSGRVFHDLRYMPALLLGGEVGEMDLDLLRADGARLPVLASARLIREDETGAPLRVLLSFAIAIERRQFEAELMEARRRAEAAEARLRQALVAAEAADAAKFRFLSAMQHEFRTPIGIITGYGELLAPGAAPAEQQQLYLADMQDAARKLLRLVEDATLYAEVSAISRPLRLMPCAISQLARQAAQLAAGRLREAGMRVMLAEGPEVVAQAEPELLRSGMASLMRELADRGVAGAKVKVSWALREDTAEVDLCCDDLSLTDLVAARLREPFGAEGLHNRTLEGAGLGVAIADQVMKLHAGVLSFERCATGGTRFRLILA
jgi:PAS domain S-box-containing protein